MGETLNGWKTLKLGDILDVKHGKNQKEVEVLGGKYPILGTGGEIGRTNVYLYNKPSVLIGRKGTIDKPRYIDNPFWTVDTLFYTNIKAGYDPKWLYYRFCKIPWKKYNEATGVPSLSASTIKSIKIEIPTFDEQKKIASILSTWDKAIELKEKLIEQKKVQKKGLMQKLLTGEVRLPGFEDDWKEIRLGNYLIKHNEKSEYSDQYPVLTSSRRGIFLQKDYYLGNEVASNDNTGYNVVPYGFFTYRHMSDDLIFKFNINTIVEKGIVSTLYPVFTTKNLNCHFLLLKLNEGNEFKRFALKQKQGGSRTYMYFSKLEELIITVPSLEEQSSIAELVGNMEKQITLLETELYNLKEQKKGLMQLLLTGKARVKV